MLFFKLFRRPSRRVPVPRARLCLEALDSRWCPDGSNPTVPDSPPDEVRYRSDGAVDGRPQIIDFEAEEIEPGLFVITGQVIDEDPGGLTVFFQGPQVTGQFVVTDEDGYFTLTVQLPTNGTGAGTISAWTYDYAGQISNIVTESVNPTIQP